MILFMTFAKNAKFREKIFFAGNTTFDKASKNFNYCQIQTKLLKAFQTCEF